MVVILAAVRDGPSPSLCDNQYADIVYQSNYISFIKIKILQCNRADRWAGKGQERVRESESGDPIPSDREPL